VTAPNVRLTTEIIVSTYNNVRSLKFCIASIMMQTYTPDSICFADDGSGPETGAAIAEFTSTSAVPVRHVWQKDDGFRKSIILNRAIASSTADYLIFIDGDVMIRHDFLSRHMELARPKRFCTGSLIRLDAAATAAVTIEDLQSGRVFDVGWLRRNRAIKNVSTWLKTAPLPKVAMAALDFASPVRPSFCGANSSAFREDILAVNGYDESIQYGGQDKELGVRLTNSGVRGQHLRYTAPLVHLAHPQPYRTAETIRFTRDKIQKTRSERSNWTLFGISKT
jgi:glycosyltransferase involved in cell wall biosynthesis